MGLYIAYTVDIKSRTANAIFDFKDGSCFLCSSKRKPSLVFKSKRFDLTTYQKLVDYAFDKHFDSYEITLIDSQNIEELLIYLTDYLKDKDISIGLITSDISFIDNNNNLLDDYGVTYSKPIVNEGLLLSVATPRLKVAHHKECGESECGAPSSIEIEELQIASGSAELYIPGPIELDESFHDKFIKHLIESGKSNVEIYKKAGITRQVFSKIVSDKNMIPSKLTLISLCIGLELSLKDAKELVMSAGYSLSKSILLDAIVMRYLSERIYDFDLINSELNEYGCQLLGWHPREN